jgi:hypothetical protein
VQIVPRFEKKQKKMAEDYISMFDRGESKDDLELSYHCSSATHSDPEEEEDLDTLQMGVPLNTGSLVPLP